MDEPDTPGGYFHQNHTWMCLPDLENLTISIPIFCLICPPISIPFSKEKHPILTKLGAFYNIWPKIHPIFLNLGCFISDEPPPIAIPNFTKKRPKRQAHIRIPCQCEDPPGLIPLMPFEMSLLELWVPLTSHENLKSLHI